jgi:hypothetical protein
MCHFVPTIYHARHIVTHDTLPRFRTFALEWIFGGTDPSKGVIKVLYLPILKPIPISSPLLAVTALQPSPIDENMIRTDSHAYAQNSINLHNAPFSARNYHSFQGLSPINS